MTTTWNIWIQLPDKTYIHSSHPNFEKWKDKYIEGSKETKDWHYVKSIFPPEYYLLKPLDNAH